MSDRRKQPNSSRTNLGLARTWQTLVRTRNVAAEDVLISALDSDDPAIQKAAIEGLLDRLSAAETRILLGRWHTISDEIKAMVNERPSRISGALRNAVLDGDSQIRRNGSGAACYFREFDLIHALINAAEDNSNAHAELAAATVLKLAELLCDELSRSDDFSKQRASKLTKSHVVDSLEKSVQRYSRQKHSEIVLSFLMLADRDNATLKKIMQVPHHACYLPVVEHLTYSSHTTVVRLLLSYLEDARAPAPAPARLPPGLPAIRIRA